MPHHASEPITTPIPGRAGPAPLTKPLAAVMPPVIEQAPDAVVEPLPKRVSSPVPAPQDLPGAVVSGAIPVIGPPDLESLAAFAQALRSTDLSARTTSSASPAPAIGWFDEEYLRGEAGDN